MKKKLTGLSAAFKAANFVLMYVICAASISSAQILWQPYNFIDAANPGTSIHIRWKTASAATVYYGTEDLDKSQIGDTLGVHLTGLTPGVHYHYKVVCNGDTSIPGSFRTAPPPGTPFSFVVMADLHSLTYETDTRNGIRNRITECYNTFSPDLLFCAGDITKDTAVWSRLFSGNPEVYANTIFVPAKGNHDAEGLWPESYEVICSVLPNNGNDYMFTYGSVTFLVSSGSTPQYYKYCDSLKTKTGFKISMQHYAPYISASSSAQTTKEGLAFENGGGQLWYSGHIHSYYRYGNGWIKTAAISGQSPEISTTQKDGFAIYMAVGAYAYNYAHVTVDSIGPGFLFHQGIRSSTTDVVAGITSVFDTFYVRTKNDSVNSIEQPRMSVPRMSGIKVFPNPSTSFMQIQLEVPKKSEDVFGTPFSIRIYDLRGRLVRTLLNGPLKAGYHTMRFSELDDGLTLENGVYLCQVKGPGLNETLKLLMVR